MSKLAAHTPGTREYLACETGVIVLMAAGEQFELAPGDVVAFGCCLHVTEE